MEKEIEMVVDYLQSLLYTDSRIPLSQHQREQLLEAVKRDVASVGDHPNRTNCEDLIMGEEGDPEVDALRELWSETDGFVASLF